MTSHQTFYKQAIEDSIEELDLTQVTGFHRLNQVPAGFDPAQLRNIILTDDGKTATSVNNQAISYAFTNATSHTRPSMLEFVVAHENTTSVLRNNNFAIGTNATPGVLAHSVGFSCSAGTFRANGGAVQQLFEPDGTTNATVTPGQTVVALYDPSTNAVFWGRREADTIVWFRPAGTPIDPFDDPGQFYCVASSGTEYYLGVGFVGPSGTLLGTTVDILDRAIDDVAEFRNLAFRSLADLRLGTAAHLDAVDPGAIAGPTNAVLGSDPRLVSYVKFDDATTLLNHQGRVAVNSTLNGFTIDLPATPADLQSHFVVDVGNSIGNNNVVLSGGAILITNEGTDQPTVTMNVRGGSVEVIYSADINRWIAIKK